MTDRELLDLAAKAAGIEVWWTENYGGVFLRDRNSPVIWNPLNDDGDALRLLCRLFLRITEERCGVYRAVQFTVHTDTDGAAEHEIEIKWPHTAADTRRAIVQAAVAIAAAKEE